LKRYNIFREFDGVMLFSTVICGVI
jgi:hypothetical protein